MQRLAQRRTACTAAFSATPGAWSALPQPDAGPAAEGAALGGRHGQRASNSSCSPRRHCTGAAESPAAAAGAHTPSSPQGGARQRGGAQGVPRGVGRVSCVVQSKAQMRRTNRLRSQECAGGGRCPGAWSYMSGEGRALRAHTTLTPFDDGPRALWRWRGLHAGQTAWPAGSKRLHSQTPTWPAGQPAWPAGCTHTSRGLCTTVDIGACMCGGFTIDGISWAVDDPSA
jgi:hypothetical protein